MKDVFPDISEEEHIQLINNTEIVNKLIEPVHEPKVPAVAYSDINDTEKKKLNLYKEIQQIIIE